MQDMFSKNDYSKPSHIMQFTEYGYIEFTRFVNLSKEHVLLIACDKKSNQTSIKLFKINNLGDCIQQEKFEGRYYFSGLMDPNTFLLSKDQGYQLIKLKIDSLKIISTIAWSSDNEIHPLSEEYFFAINRVNHLLGSPFELKFYQWDQNKPILKQRISFYQSDTDCGLRSIQSLGNGRFAAHIYGYNSNEFRVLIFECTVNPVSNMFRTQVCHNITPAEQGFESGSAASGEILALPNGHLLTYHKHHDGLQIWNTTSGECIKQWYWKNIKHKKNFASFIKITSFPDQKNLLIHRKDSLYIFNMNVMTIKRITIKNLHCLGQHHILPNSNLLAFHNFKEKGYIDLLKLSHFTIPETQDYQRTLKSYLFAKVLTFLYCAKVLQWPNELTLHIISYAFTPETKHQFIGNYPNNVEDTRSNNLCKH